jgi:hypothetical protein
MNELIAKAEAELSPEVRSQLRPRFLNLLGLTDPGLTEDRIWRDLG